MGLKNYISCKIDKGLENYDAVDKVINIGAAKQWLGGVGMGIGVYVAAVSPQGGKAQIGGILLAATSAITFADGTVQEPGKTRGLIAAAVEKFSNYLRQEPQPQNYSPVTVN